MDGKDDLIRILIADDHPIFRSGLRSLLSSEPRFRVVGEAGDGEEALAMVRRLKPDILILDLSMPRLPGMEALRELTASASPARIIILTVAIEKLQMIEALQLGARGIVLKDTATAVVMDCIRAVREGHFWVGRNKVTDIMQCLRELMAQAGTPKVRKTFGLTPRELEVVAAIVTGLSNREIAQKFSLSEQTVKHHLTNIFNKTGVSSRLELAIFAVNHQLVSN
jgi:DNA-binding NarL/FixJ family response regulator